MISFEKPVPTLSDHALVARWLRRDRRRRVGRDRYGRSRLQLELAERDHAVARLQTFQDFGAPLDPVAGLHEAARCGQAGFAVVFLLLGDQEDGIAIERIIHRRFRNGDDRRLVWQHHRGGCEHAGLEDALGVGDRRLNANVARVGGDLWLDGRDIAFKGFARIGVDLDANDVPNLQIAAVLFRNGEVGVELRQIGQRYDLGARGQELADLDTAHAKLTV